jgi:hypothetical protein
MPANGEKPSAIGRETRQTVLSVGLSAAVAFGVASYTVERSDDAQKRDAERTRLSAVYTPLSSAAAALFACIPDNRCTNRELFRNARAYNAAETVAIGQGSPAVSAACHAFDKAVGPALRFRGTHGPYQALSPKLITRTVAPYADFAEAIRRELRP